MRKAFTLIELIFVIIIFGIMSSFGAELLYKVYENYVYSNTFNRLQNQSEAAVKQIANRLQYRIKDSTIARVGTGGGILEIGDNIANATVLEWIGTDIDGWRGTTRPTWSGFIDLDASLVGTLSSPGSSLNQNGAIFFIGSDVNLSTDFGWGSAINNQSKSLHPVTMAGTSISDNTTGAADFSGADIYEYYQYTRTAYAIHLNGTNLILYDNYQPWDGDNINTVATRTASLLMENVSSFKFTSMGDILIIQVCVSDGNVTGVGEYSVCKEKVVF